MSEKPLRLPLIATTSNRGEQTDVDARLINGYMEKTPLGEVWCYKRPGYAQYLGFAAATGRGIFRWNNHLYSIFGTSVKKDGSAIGVVTADTTLYTFAASMGATPLLFFNAYDKAYTTDGATVTQVVDGDYPAITVPGAVYLDGTTYVMTPDGYIQGSDLNDPTSWDPLNSIRVQLDPDDGIAIAKQLNYLVAFKQFSVEVFYDAGNAAGSPLGRVEAAKLSVGCAFAYSIASFDGALLWISASRQGNRKVMMMEALKAREISTPPIDRLLQGADSPYGVGIQISGHRFYLLSDINFGLQTTLVYDLDEKLWYTWTLADGSSMSLVSSSVGTAAISDDGSAVAQTHSTGEVIRFDTSLYADEGAAFPWDLYTPNFDADTRLSKTLNKLEVTADQQDNSMLEVRWSDDDYKIWSAPRTLDLSLQQAWTTKLGKFIKRAHHFHQQLNVPLRIKAVDLHLDLGTL